MRRRTAVAGVVATLALLISAGTVAWVVTRPSGPEDTARAYLEALETGDADALAGLIVSEDAEPADAFAAASSYPQRPRIDQLTETGSGAAVQATAAFDGAEREISFGLRLIDGRWRVAGDFLATVEVGTTVGDAVLVGDVLLPAGPVLLLPAVYEFSAAPRGLVDGSVTAAVSTDRPTDVQLEASLSPEATARLQEQVDAYARECTAGGTAVPEACGLRIPWAADLASASAFAYRVERLPTLALSPDVRTFVASGGVVVATVTGVDRAGAQTSFTYRDDAWTLRGDVVVTGEDIVLAVR
ncbi:hypothetical protein [Microbacterium lushaniae]|uniref:Uncharacterized protein n=1 Tax=Microbacterium lushaniae TaxID=2614639 RepID=A0A5J6L4T5_9MICO|nr:hypothetical protein [Microbacterium lushaniae]QEW03649.1 hypothetical protein F6J85_11445 [Microbacterium lushaniae]